ncbi:MAG TPA: pantoate--beta-alanine ligase [Bacteroidia bacterium]|jgi:pantoate--beta-alanine ligase
MIIINKVGELRNYLDNLRKEQKTIGFVPTMGALHEGHLTLVKQSKTENNITVCSIFVNPTQFNDPSDLAKYPRTLESDSLLLKDADCDVIFAPPVNEIYTREELSLKLKNVDDNSWKEGKHVDFGMLDKVMEGEHRPGHFNGVAQVVSKLFRIVQPDKAYFGQKDFQQLAIIRSMTKQLELPVEIVSCPIIREPDGLAMSSRNTRLSETDRKAASLISATLFKIKEYQDKLSFTELKQMAAKEIGKEPRMELEYFEIADADTLQPVANKAEAKSAVACIALKLGEVRLIDNVMLY